MTEETTRKNGLPQELIRGLFMILFFLIARIVAVLVFLLAVFQFCCVLIVRTPNRNALRFGKGLSRYLAEIVDFLSYNTDRKPWPFASWPGTEPTQLGVSVENGK